MTLSRPLVWKEWAESRSILLIGTIIFLVLPLIGALERIIQYRGFEFWASPWVVMLGGVLAIVAGVGVIIPDVTRRFEFIRSQPIPLTRWIVTKYLIGIAVVVPTLFVPLAIEFLIVRTSEFSGYYLAALLAALPFTWIAIYSIAFALACIIRRTSLAIVAAIFAMLVLYFLPPLIPSLQFLGLKQVADDLTHATLGQPSFQLRGSVAFHSGYFLFAFTLLAISAIALLIAVKVINHDWQIRSNRKTITWTIGILVLAPLATASLQLGSNMPVLQTLALENREQPFRLLSKGDDVVLVTHVNAEQQESGQRLRVGTYFRRVTIGPTITLGPKIDAGTTDWLPVVMSSVHDMFYSMTFSTTSTTRPAGTEDQVNVSYPILVATRLPQSGSESIHAETESLNLPELADENWGMPIYVCNPSTLTVITGKHQLTFNIADPIHPKLTAHKTLSTGVRYSIGQGKAEFLYPPDCDVPGDQLMLAYNESNAYDGTGDSQLYLRPHEGGLMSYVRAGAGPGYVQFTFAGEYTPLPIDRLVANDNSSDWIAVTSGFAATRSGRVLLFDTSDPSRPRRIGHYTSPRERTQVFAVFPDGRVLVDAPAHNRTADGKAVAPQMAVLGKP